MKQVFIFLVFLCAFAKLNAQSATSISTEIPHMNTPLSNEIQNLATPVINSGHEISVDDSTKAGLMETLRNKSTKITVVTPTNPKYHDAQLSSGIFFEGTRVNGKFVPSKIIFKE